MFVKLFRPECTCKRIYQFSNWQNTLLPRLENYSRFKRIIGYVLSSKSFFEVVQLLSQHNWSSLSSKSGENCVNRVALARIFQFGKNKQRKYFSFRTFMDTTKKDTIGKKKNVSDFSYASLQVRSKSLAIRRKTTVFATCFKANGNFTIARNTGFHTPFHL